MADLEDLFPELRLNDPRFQVPRPRIELPEVLPDRPYRGDTLVAPPPPPNALMPQSREESRDVNRSFLDYFRDYNPLYGAGQHIGRFIRPQPDQYGVAERDPADLLLGMGIFGMGLGGAALAPRITPHTTRTPPAVRNITPPRIETPPPIVERPPLPVAPRDRPENIGNRIFSADEQEELLRALARRTDRNTGVTADIPPTTDLISPRDFRVTRGSSGIDQPVNANQPRGPRVRDPAQDEINYNMELVRQDMRRAQERAAREEREGLRDRLRVIEGGPGSRPPTALITDEQRNLNYFNDLRRQAGDPPITMEEFLRLRRFYDSEVPPGTENFRRTDQRHPLLQDVNPARRETRYAGLRDPTSIINPSGPSALAKPPIYNRGGAPIRAPHKGTKVESGARSNKASTDPRDMTAEHISNMTDSQRALYNRVNTFLREKGASPRISDVSPEGTVYLQATDPRTGDPIRLRITTNGYMGTLDLTKHTHAMTERERALVRSGQLSQEAFRIHPGEVIDTGVRPRPGREEQPLYTRNAAGELLGDPANNYQNLIDALSHRLSTNLVPPGKGMQLPETRTRTRPMFTDNSVLWRNQFRDINRLPEELTKPLPTRTAPRETQLNLPFGGLSGPTTVPGRKTLSLPGKPKQHHEDFRNPAAAILRPGETPFDKASKPPNYINRGSAYIISTRDGRRVNIPNAPKNPVTEKNAIQAIKDLDLTVTGVSRSPSGTVRVRFADPKNPTLPGMVKPTIRITDPKNPHMQSRPSRGPEQGVTFDTGWGANDIGSKRAKLGDPLITLDSRGRPYAELPNLTNELRRRFRPDLPQPEAEFRTRKPLAAQLNLPFERQFRQVRNPAQAILTPGASPFDRSVRSGPRYGARPALAEPIVKRQIVPINRNPETGRPRMDPVTATARFIGIPEPTVNIILRLHEGRTPLQGIVAHTNLSERVISRVLNRLRKLKRI